MVTLISTRGHGARRARLCPPYITIIACRCRAECRRNVSLLQHQTFFEAGAVVTSPRARRAAFETFRARLIAEQFGFLTLIQCRARPDRRGRIDALRHDALQTHPLGYGGAICRERLYVDRILRGEKPRDLAVQHGPYTTVYNRFNRWSARGIWQRIFETVADPSEPPEEAALDSTHVKAHRCAGGGKGGLLNRRSASPEAAATASFTPWSISIAARG